MKLIGSRNIGIHSEWSDYDYATIDIGRTGGRQDITNEQLARRQHCYHYPEDYRARVAVFETDEDDFNWIYNAEEFKAGLITTNPLDYKAEWIGLLKTIDFFTPLWWHPRLHIPRKRVWHIVYNLEVIKEGTTDLSEQALTRVRQWHDGNVDKDEYQALIEEIKAL